MKQSAKWVLPFSFIFLFLCSGGVLPQTNGNASQTNFCERFNPCQLLLQADAEKILGQPVRLTQNISELKGDVRQCSCAYISVAKDKTTGQDTHLYFAVEQREVNPSAEQAQQVMESTRSSNAHDTTILTLSGIGDEAFQLGDQPNRPFIMARKGGVIIRLQIREATALTSLEKLKAFAGEVAKRL